MPNLKEIRNRIQSINSIMQITAAMKMVSAAKLKKAQKASKHIRLYSDKIHSMLHSLIERNEGPLPERRENKSSKILLIPITSNKGLCGVFNALVIKKVHEIAKKSDKEIHLLPIGKKGSFSFLKTYKIYKNKNGNSKYTHLTSCGEIIEDILRDYEKQELSSIKIVFNYPRNAMLQEVVVEEIFSTYPLEMNKQELLERVKVDHLLEPSKESVFSYLRVKCMKICLFKALLESSVSEHAARMMAMHKASENASNLKSELSLTYNKARQASITKEILEIAAGAEVLK